MATGCRCPDRPDRGATTEWAYGPFFVSLAGARPAGSSVNRQREELRQLLEPAVEAMGYELADLELRLGRGRGLLRLFIDSEAGIGLDDCEQVSRQVSALLDVEDPGGAYHPDGQPPRPPG